MILVILKITLVPWLFEGHELELDTSKSYLVNCSYQGKMVEKVEEIIKKHKSALAGKPSAATFYQILLPPTLPQRITQSNKILLALGLPKEPTKAKSAEKGTESYLQLSANTVNMWWWQNATTFAYRFLKSEMFGFSYFTSRANSMQRVLPQSQYMVMMRQFPPWLIKVGS